MQATQGNLTHLFFSASMGFSDMFRMAERIKPVSTYAVGAAMMMGRVREKTGRGRHEGWGCTKGMTP